ncbi:MAG: (high mobility group) box [Pseudomonadota bacterium]|jgi:hypothetical protein
MNKKSPKNTLKLRPPTSYNVFTAQNYPKLQSEHPDWSFGTLSKAISEMWKSVNKEEYRKTQKINGNLNDYTESFRQKLCSPKRRIKKKKIKPEYPNSNIVNIPNNNPNSNIVNIPFLPIPNNNPNSNIVNIPFLPIPNNNPNPNIDIPHPKNNLNIANPSNASISNIVPLPISNNNPNLNIVNIPSPSISISGNNPSNASISNIIPYPQKIQYPPDTGEADEIYATKSVLSPKAKTYKAPFLQMNDLIVPKTITTIPTLSKQMTVPLQMNDISKQMTVPLQMNDISQQMNVPLQMNDISPKPNTTNSQIHLHHSPQKFSPRGRIDPGKITKEDLYKKLNVRTCKEIRKELETTNMTDEQKLNFLETYNKSYKSLRDFVESQNINLDELKFYADGGSLIMNTIANRTKEYSNIMFSSSSSFDVTDPDCKYLNELLEKLKNDPKNTSLNQSFWKTLGSLATRTGENIWQGAKYVAGKSSDFFNWIGVPYFLNYLKIKGIKLFEWFVADPKIAFFTLLTLKNLKNRLCRRIGQEIGYYGKETDVQWIISKYKSLTGKDPPPNSTFEDMKEYLYEISGPLIFDYSAKFGVQILNLIWDKGLSFLMPGYVTGMLESLGSLIPGVGPIVSNISSMLSSFFGLIFETAKEDISFVLEQSIYANYTYNSFSMLLQIINPFQCMENMVREIKTVTSPQKGFFTGLFDGRPIKKNQKKISRKKKKILSQRKFKKKKKCKEN